MIQAPIQAIIGIDAGGTKVAGRIVELSTEKSWQQLAGPGSLSNDLELASQNIKQVALGLLKQSQTDAKNTIIICGAAGALNKALNDSINDTLKTLGFAAIEITSDARISLYGANLGEPVVVVALGTGSVAMRLDENGHEKQFGGWGFITSDQGSGANIGRDLVSETLRAIDADNFEADSLIASVQDVIGENSQSILKWLTTATPAIYAQLATLVMNNAEHRLAKKIIKKASSDVEELIRLSRANKELPLCLLGGLALVMKPHLNEELQKHIKTPKGNAVDGALFLGRRLLHKMEMADG